jgi:threonine dehydratase
LNTDVDLARIAEAAQVVDPVFRDSPQFMSEQLSGVLGLPVSDGGLITGVGQWIKARSPATRVIGVCPAAAPAVALSWRAGRVVRSEPAATIADSLTMREPAPEAVRRMRGVVDDMVLVTDSSLRHGIGLAARGLGLFAEPSGAAGLTAIACHDLPGEIIATVLTGAAIG